MITFSRRAFSGGSLIIGGLLVGAAAAGLAPAAAADIKIVYGHPKPDAEMRRRIRCQRWLERRRETAFRRERRQEKLQARQAARWSDRFVRSLRDLFS